MNRFIKNNQYVFSANFLQKNFKDLKDFSKPYIFITKLARRHQFLTSENPKIEMHLLTRLAD